MFDYLFYVYLKVQNKNTFILKCSKSLSLCNVSNYTYLKKLDKNNIKLVNQTFVDSVTKGLNQILTNKNKDVISLKDFIN